jgi:hypothetical protein
MLREDYNAARLMLTAHGFELDEKLYLRRESPTTVPEVCTHATIHTASMLDVVKLVRNWLGVYVSASLFERTGMWGVTVIVGRPIDEQDAERVADYLKGTEARNERHDD